MAATAGYARGDETNVWPFWVTQAETGQPDTVTALGPLIFRQPIPGDPHLNEPILAEGIRPIYLAEKDEVGRTTDAYFVYPLFSYHRTPDGYRWSLFSLVNHFSTQDSGHAPRADRGFDLWPFYFSRDTGSPETSYHAFFPIYGSVKNRFFVDQFTWVLFPLYGRFEKGPKVTTAAPWPFIKVLKGGGHHGFDLWPIFGKQEKEGDYRHQFYLWPLVYKSETHRSEAKPDVKLGFLPFYARETNADSMSETYVWPFFGYTDRTAPYRYHEVRYFWPFLVQAQGDQRYINRWGPFYTHSIMKGVDKTWIAWPLWRQQQVKDGGLIETKKQLLYFFYYSTVQRSATSPALPTGRKTHIWPFVSIWKNGAGQEQIQALSPLEVFFPGNEVVQLKYNPLFALYRYSQSPDSARQSLLWGLVDYRREADKSEFHLGPLFGRETRANAKRFTLGNGLFGIDRTVTSDHWRFFFFEFKHLDAPRASDASQP